MKRCLNIGIFTDVYKPVVNGVVTSIENLFNYMEKLNHKIYIFAPEYPGYKDERNNIYRFKSVNLWSKVNYPLGLPYSRRIFKIINSLDLDIIHCHHPFLMGRAGQHIAGKLHIPLVATLHTQYEEYIHYVPFNRYIIRTMTLWALKHFSNKCDTLIIPAESRKRQLEKYGIYSRIKVIPNCIEPARFNRLNGKKIKDRYSISQEKKILIFVGRLAREKNIEFLITCFKEIHKEYKNIKLMLVGDGPERKKIENFINRENLSEHVILTGEINNKDIKDYYGAADIFVSTSKTEVHPVVLLEAMACALPVVAVRGPGYEDTLRHGVDGLLCEEHVGKFSASVLSLLNDRLKRETISKQAKERSMDFSVKNITGQIENIYLSLVKN